MYIQEVRYVDRKPIFTGRLRYNNYSRHLLERGPKILSGQRLKQPFAVRSGCWREHPENWDWLNCKLDTEFIDVGSNLINLFAR